MASDTVMDGAAARTPVAASHHFPCDGCGSDMRFSAQSGAMECSHCTITRPLPDTPLGTPLGGAAEKRPLDQGVEL